MKKIIIYILFFIASNYAFSQTTKNDKIPADTIEKIFTSVEKMPEFPGGPSAMRKYISEHIVYPNEALVQEVTGRVIIKFVIDRLGNLKDFVILRDIGGLGKEAVRIVSQMPPWIPGKQNGMPVSVYYTLPISFKLLNGNKNPIDSMVTDTFSDHKVYGFESLRLLTSPQFVGGRAKLDNYIKTNIKYPESAKSNQIEGAVEVKFIVDKDGSILFPETSSNILGKEYGREAVKLVQSMPKWIPASLNGVAVRYCSSLSVTFKLQEQENDHNMVLESGDPILRTLKKEDRIFTWVELSPEFPSGMAALQKFLSVNMIYPNEAKEKGLSGRAILKFIVEIDGSITNIEIQQQTPGSGFGKEAVRLVSIMPKWKPAKQNGKPVRTYYTLPVIFKL